MSNIQSVFKRYEQKYMVTKDEYEAILFDAEPYISDDRYPFSTVCNVYYDTPDNLLIRRSLEKPRYKEKLRLRSYGVPERDDKVFIELKKKYEGIVYKRRTSMTLEKAESFLCGEVKAESQIEREIEYALNFYKGIAPSMYICYDRESFVGDNSFRLTFDSNILWRKDKPCLDEGAWGERVIDSDTYIMEVKSPTSMPLWLVKSLDRLKIYPTSFSKYGRAYIIWQNSLLREKAIQTI